VSWTSMLFTYVFLDSRKPHLKTGEHMLIAESVNRG